VEFDPLAASSTDIYAIKDANYAAYAIAVDQVAKRLYIGEKKDDGTGQFAILKVEALNEAPTTLSLPLPPYGVEFVR
jgi:hypothetical protein